MRKHGGLLEIIRSKQAPAGFVRQDGGALTSTTQRASWKKEADFIARKKKRSGRFKGMELLAVGSQTEELKLHHRSFDGDPNWRQNKDALNFLKRAGHPTVTMNPALAHAAG